MLMFGNPLRNLATRHPEAVQSHASCNLYVILFWQEIHCGEFHVLRVFFQIVFSKAQPSND